MTSRRDETVPKDWEDEYRRLKETHKELQLISNDQVETIRKLTAKARKLESDFNTIERQQGGTVKTPRVKEDENLVNNLYEQISKLKNQIISLSDRNKTLVDQLEKKKKENDMLKRAVARSKPPGITPSFHKTGTDASIIVEIQPAPKPGQLGSSSSMSRKAASSTKEMIAPPTATTGDTTDSKLLAIAQNLKSKLAESEDKFMRAQSEINRLQSMLPSKEFSSRQTSSMPEGEAQWRLQQLQTQYDMLVAKNASQSSAYKTSETQLEEYAKKVRDLRRALEELRVEKDQAESKTSRYEELEEQVRELRKSNRSLEDKIAKLCEAPFINDAFRHQEYRLKSEDLERDREDYQNKIDHLQEAVKTHYAALVSLKQQAAKLREGKEAAEKVAEDMKMKYLEVEKGSHEVRDKLSAFTGDGVDMEALERALTMVKRRGESVVRLDFLEDPDGDHGPMTIPSLKKKLQDVQVINMNLTMETERMENMLKLQTDINRDLHRELEGLIKKVDKDKHDSSRRLGDFEDLAMKRLNKIHSLEAQIRQLVYGVSKKPLIKQIDDNATITSENDNGLLAELINEEGGDINPDENLLEVWVKSGNIRDVVIPAGTSSFLVIDFFDYESQTTALAPGNKPQWDFAATFKLAVDDFLLRYLATDVLTLELNTASQGDFNMLARCSIPISGLLKSRPFMRLVNHPMLSVKSGEIIAYVNLDIRLALPVTEFYRMFLERHPGERRRIEEASTKRLIESNSSNVRASLLQLKNHQDLEDESRLYNELEITIMKAAGLPMSVDKEPPSAYVHFQLLGHPDKFTNPRPFDANPIFNEKFVFPMVTTEQQLRMLRRSQLLLTVIDMKVEELDDSIDAGEGIIGELSISLVELADGNAVVSSYSIKDKDSKRVGELELSMRWKTPLKKQRDLGPLALSGVEVERIISVFSAADINQVSVDYASFCRYIDPPKGAVRARDAMHTFISRTAEHDGRSPASVLRLLLSDSNKITESEFTNTFLKLHVDVLPTEFSEFFTYIDVDKSGAIAVEELLSALHLDDMVKIPPGLLDKLTARVKELATKKLYPLKFFEDADSWGVRGQMTRLEFKKVLQKLGFLLVDEPTSALDEVSEKPPRQQIQSNKQSSVPVSGDEEVLGEVGVGAGAGGADPRVQEMSEYLKQQREVFEKKLAEMHIQSQSLADQAIKSKRQSHHDLQQHTQQHQQSVETPRPVDGAKDVSLGLNLLDTPASSFTADDGDPYALRASHITGVVGRNEESSVSSMPQGKVVSTSEPAVKARRPSSGGNNSAMRRSVSGDIITAEQSLRRALSALDAATIVPDFMKAFVRVDAKRTGYVNRMQFAHVFKQMEAISLKPEDLAALMQYFDTHEGGEGEAKIDYTAFVKFVKFKVPSDLPSAPLRHMIFNYERVEFVRSFDSTGKRVLRRADMLRALAELGYGQSKHEKAVEMLSFFETNTEGHVNYENFLEYVLENPLCAMAMYEKLACDFRDSLLDEENDISEECLNRYFSNIDTTGKGFFGLDDLVSFISSIQLSASKAVIGCLFQSMDSERRGAVYFKDFKAWVHRRHQDTARLLFPSLSSQQIQRKAQVYLSALMTRGDTSFDVVLQSYAIYDWKLPPVDYLHPTLFIEATRRLGFVFSQSEYACLVAEFAMGNDKSKVAYKKFLDWAMPSQRGGSGSGISQGNNTPGMSSVEKRNSTANISSFLENAIQNGADLLSCFGRYDIKNVGRITADEFCSGLSDLGLSSVTQQEALSVGERFKAATGDFIMYRRVVTELLRQLDETTGADNVDLIDVIHAGMQRKRVTVGRLNDIFEYYDRKGKGRIRMEDLGTVFEEAGIILRKKEIHALADRYTIGDSDWVQYASLITALEDRAGSIGSKKTDTSLLSEELIAKVKRFLEALILKGVDFRKEFDTLDDTYSGTLSQADFKDVLLTRLKYDMNEKEFDILVAVFKDKEDIRRVNYIRFLTELHPSALSKLSEEYFDRSSALEATEELRRLIRRRCEYMHPGELKRPWKHFAGRGGGKEVGMPELSTGLRKLGMQVSPENERCIMDTICLDEFTVQDKKFSYPDFLVFVRDPFHRDVVWKFRRLLSRAGVSEKEITMSLREQDTNDSGLLTVKQFNKALAGCNIQISDSDAIRLLVRFDEDDNNMLNIGLFIIFLKGGRKDIGGGVGRDGSSQVASMTAATRARLGASVDESTVAGESDALIAWNALKERIEDKLLSGFSAAETYAIFANEGGTIDLASLHRGAREVGLAYLTRAEVRGILRRMCLSVGAVTDSKAFFKAFSIDVEDLVNFGKKSTATSRNKRDGKDDDEGGIKSVLVTMRKDLEAGFRGKDIGVALEKGLHAFDVDSDGALTLREFIKALPNVKIDIEESDAKAVFSAMSKPLEGSDIDVIEIHSVKEAIISLRAQKNTRSLEESIKYLFERYRVTLEDNFGSRASATINMKKLFADEIGEGDKTTLVTEKQFKRVMKLLSLDTMKYQDADVTSVFAYFDIDDKGLINYEDVILHFFPNNKNKKSNKSKSKSGPEEDDNEKGSVGDGDKEVKDVTDLLDRIRRKIEDNFGQAEQETKDAFLEVLEGYGKSTESTLVDKKVFGKAMTALKVRVSTAEVDDIYMTYLRTKRGSDKDYIDYAEFIEKLNFTKQTKAGGGGATSSNSKRK